MPKLFNFEILTPDKVFFGGEIQSLIVNSSNGKLGILSNSISKVVTLRTGICSYLYNDEWHEIALGNGFMEVHPLGARAFVQFAVTPEELDAMTEDEYDLQEELNKKAQSRREYKMAKAYLARQFSNLKKKSSNTLD